VKTSRFLDLIQACNAIAGTTLNAYEILELLGAAWERCKVFRAREFLLAALRKGLYCRVGGA